VSTYDILVIGAFSSLVGGDTVAMARHATRCRV
jgi:hypothetical protein